MPEIKRKKRETVSDIADQVKKTIDEPVEKLASLKNRKLISTGSTMLNLALSDGNPYGGYALGTVVHIIGDTHAGKSLLALTGMAEASIDKELDDYDLVYEEPESAMFFDLERFGKKAQQRIIFHPPKEERVEPRTVQKWHHDLTTWKLPFIWVTDSFDSLTSDELLDDDNPTKGGWKTEKAGVASQLFPKIVGRIESSDSLFVWISQTRDNIGVTFGSKKNFTGGNAIKFYRSYEIWLAVESPITKDLKNKKKEKIGSNVLVNVKKNKFTGKRRIISFPIYDDYGIDDIRSIINFLVDEGFWIKPKGKSAIETEEPFIDGKIEKIIKHIEDNNLESKLKEVVAECWKQREDELAVNKDRKPKYE